MKKKIFSVAIIITIITAGLGVKKMLSVRENKTVEFATTTKSENKASVKQIQSHSEEKKKGNFIESLVIVNRENRLDRNYSPKDLITPNVKFVSNGDLAVRKMNNYAGQALERLFDAAKKDGITLLAVSGYRTYDYQETLYNNKVNRCGKEEADKYVAQPGSSEHQTGLAMDVVSTENTSLEQSFENTKAYNWFKKNASKYGFIIRYPKGKEKITGYNFEPWHLRYVGIATATSIDNDGITLEEFLMESGVNK